jgi:nucleotide-binding universal stress UspA family protein
MRPTPLDGTWKKPEAYSSSNLRSGLLSFCDGLRAWYCAQDVDASVKGGTHEHRRCNRWIRVCDRRGAPLHGTAAARGSRRARHGHPRIRGPTEDAGGIEGPVISEKQAEKDWKKDTAAGQAALDRTAAALGTDAEVRLVPDDEATGSVIVRVAGETKADVLVVGSSSKGWLSRLFGNSVSDYVAHHAPCPVMLIRHDHW